MRAFSSTRTSRGRWKCRCREARDSVQCDASDRCRPSCAKRPGVLREAPIATAPRSTALQGASRRRRERLRLERNGLSLGTRVGSWANTTKCRRQSARTHRLLTEPERRLAGATTRAVSGDVGGNGGGKPASGKRHRFGDAWTREQDLCGARHLFYAARRRWATTGSPSVGASTVGFRCRMNPGFDRGAIVARQSGSE